MITRYTLQLADGSRVTGAIHGAGGLIGAGPHNFRRVNVAIANATAGKPLLICEPKPGHVRMYPNATAADGGEVIDVDVRGARLVCADDAAPGVAS